MSVSIADLRKGIEEFEKSNWFGDYVYFNTVNELKDIRKDPSKLTEEILREVVHVYLIEWGQMARVLNQGEIHWDEITDRLKAKKSCLLNLSDATILDIDTTNPVRAEDIRQLFIALDHRWKIKTKKGIKEHGLKQTCISKTLHLLNPRLFVMWDSNIRGNPKTRETWQDYYVRFMGDEKAKLQNILSDAGITGTEREIVATICKGLELKSRVLELCMNKSLVKLMDEYEWWHANKYPNK